MDLYLYSFSKKERSTKRPTGGQLFQGNLREPSGILSPTLALQFNPDFAPTSFNYCYIPDFGRYYWIDEWTFIHGCLWHARTHVDVLASWKDQIGAKNFYILRSSAAYNGRVIDSKYPIISRPYSYIDDMGTVYETDGGTDYAVPNFFNTTLGAGYYYIGVIGNNGTGVKWYVMDAYGFNKLAGDLMSYVPADITDFSAGVAKQLSDPIQYIVSSYWLPYLIHGAVLDQAGVDIYFGSYSIRAVHCVTFDPIGNMHKFHADFSIRKHPQAASRGVFLNQQPYTRYTVDFQPFGVFELDGTLMIDDTTVTCEWYVDYSTGKADMIVKATNSFIAHSSAMLAVPVRLSQATLDLTGMGADTALGLLGVSAQNSFWKPIIGNAVSEINSVALQPKIASSGASGSFIPFKSISPKLYTDFYLVADEDNAENGRPLCQVSTPASLGGYIQTLEGDIDIPATSSELSAISGYMTGGFFYE